ncbi:MAG: hypothetical protein AB1611_18740 [bacterium]
MSTGSTGSETAGIPCGCEQFGSLTRVLLLPAPPFASTAEQSSITIPPWTGGPVKLWPEMEWSSSPCIPKP